MFERVLVLNPNASYANSTLAWVLGQLGRYDEALAAAQRYADQAPNEGRAHQSLAAALLAVSRTKESEAEPASPWSRASRGAILAHSQESSTMCVRTILTACALSCMFACSSSSSPAGSSSGGGDDGGGASEDAGLTSDQNEAFSTGGSSLSVNQEMAVLANSLFDFDPTIDAGATPQANASAIGANIKSALDGCGTVSVSGASVTVAFGAPPGCTLSGGVSISGTVSVAVSQSSGTTTIALSLTSVVVDGKSLAGTASFATSSGSTFDVTTNLTSGTTTDTAQLTITGASGSFTVSGTAHEMQTGGTSTIVFDDVVVVNGECYATSGSMQITKGIVSETITFDAQTPTTGIASVTVGKHTVTQALPAYGSCPSGGRDGGHNNK